MNSNEWNAFKSKELHLIHLNINSPLPKIDELQYIANSSTAAVLQEFPNLKLMNLFVNQKSK